MSLYDDYLIGPKLLYFFTLTYHFSFYAFRGLFIKKYHEIDPFWYGLMASGMALVSFLATTFWPNLADRTGQRKRIFIILVTLSCSVFFLLYFRPFPHNDFLRIGYVLVVLLLYAGLSNGTTPLLCQTVLELLDQKNARDYYGRQVLFGSLAYVTSTSIAGIVNLYDVFYIKFVAAAILLAVLVFVIPNNLDSKGGGEFTKIMKDNKGTDKLEVKVANVVKSTNEGNKLKGLKGGTEEIGETREVPNIQNIRVTKIKEFTDSGTIITGTSNKLKDNPKRSSWELLKNKEFSMFLLVILITGAARSIMSSFLPFFFEDENGLNIKDDFYIAILLIAGVIVEVICFILSNQLARISNFRLLALAQLAMVMRSWCYVLLPYDFAYFAFYFAAELLKGLAFGLTQIAGVRIACELAPPHLKTTAQGWYEGCYAQFPAVFATLLAGLVYREFGPFKMFLSTAIGLSFAFTLITLFFLVSGKL